MANLMSVGQRYQNDAMQGFQATSQMAEQRKRTGDNIKQAEKSEKKSMMATGAGIGAMVGGPIGAGVGLALGYVASELF